MFGWVVWCELVWFLLLVLRLDCYCCLIVNSVGIHGNRRLCFVVYPIWLFIC